MLFVLILAGAAVLLGLSMVAGVLGLSHTVPDEARADVAGAHFIAYHQAVSAYFVRNKPAVFSLSTIPSNLLTFPPGYTPEPTWTNSLVGDTLYTYAIVNTALPIVGQDLSTPPGFVNTVNTLGKRVCTHGGFGSLQARCSDGVTLVLPNAVDAVLPPGGVVIAQR